MSIMDSILWTLEVIRRWINLKIYQYEVTFAVCMLTRVEKFIFSMFNGQPKQALHCIYE